MNIISARYANPEGGVLLTRDNMPDLYVAGGDIHRRAVNGEFGDLGELPAPDPMPDPVPQVVSRFQARAALLQSDMLEAAEAAVKEGDAMTTLAWQDATEFRRQSPAVAAIADALSLSAEQLDDLFRLAATIEA